MNETATLGIKDFGQRYRLLLFLVIVTLPVSITANSIFIALFFLNAFTAAPGAYRIFLKKGFLFRLFLFLFLLYAGSILYSENGGEAIARIQTKAGLLILPFAIFQGLPSATSRYRSLIIKGFVISVLLCALFCLIFAFYKYLTEGSWYRYWSNGSIRDHRLFYTGLADPVMHPGYFSIYVGISIFLCLHLLRLLRQKAWIYVSIPFLVVFLFLLQGRMNLIAFALIVAGFILFTLIKRARYRSLILFFAGATLLVLAAVKFLPSSATVRFTEAFNPDYDITSSSFDDFSGISLRLAEWECAWPVISNSWATGVGIGDAQDRLMQSYIAKEFALGIERNFNCHNQFLETWLATGIFGLLALLAILARLLWIAAEKRKTELAMISLYFFLSMITESMLERHWGIALLSSLIFFLGSYEEKGRSG